MRSLSSVARESLLQPATGEVFLVLLDLHISGETYRVVNNNEPILSNGFTYHPYAFDLILPADSMDGDPHLMLELDAVDRFLTDALRRTVSPPQMTLRVIVASQPDVVEAEISDFVLREVTETGAVLQCRLTLDDTWGNAFPSRGATYDPSQAPGLF